jgi:hypothetical protein
VGFLSPLPRRVPCFLTSHYFTRGPHFHHQESRGLGRSRA